MKYVMMNGHQLVLTDGQVAKLVKDGLIYADDSENPDSHTTTTELDMQAQEEYGKPGHEIEFLGKLLLVE